MPVNVAPEESIQLSFTFTASKCYGPVRGKVIFKVRDYIWCVCVCSDHEVYVFPLCSPLSVFMLLHTI